MEEQLQQHRATNAIQFTTLFHSFHSVLVVKSVGRLVVGRFVSKFFTFQVFCDDLYIKWPKKGKQIEHFSPFYVRHWFQLGTCLIEINVEKVATHPGCEKKQQQKHEIRGK